MSFRGKFGILAVLVVILLVIGCTKQAASPSKASTPNPEDLSKLEQFNVLADELYQQSTSGNFRAAYDKTEEIGQFMTGMRFQGITTAEGVKALADTVSEVRRTFAAAKLEPDKAVLVAAKLRLAADALTHKAEPMWHQYDKVLQEDLKQMAAATEQQQLSALNQTFLVFQQHYMMIRPSLLISRDPSQAEKADSFVTFMQNSLQAKKPPYADISAGIERFSGHVGELFDRHREDKTVYLPISENHYPILWSMLLGLFIISVLSFAAWRMFPSMSGAPRIRSQREKPFKSR